MNTGMYENPVTQDNLRLLEQYGMTVVKPATGRLACGDVGAGKMPEPEELLQYVLMACAYEKDLVGKKVLVTAGPTQEALDPVRYVTNHSTGKMGYSIAKVCALRGAEVTLVTGKTALACPPFVEVVPVVSAEEMFREVTARSDQMDIVIKAAAVADYRPKHVSDEKVKKSGGDLKLEMERTQDILGYLGSHKKEGQYLCGFAMETQNLLENARGKLEKKHADMIVANNLKVQGAGFGTDTNVVTLITKEGMRELAMMSKEEVAEQILNEIIRSANQ
jgi:phosphopantothenoylcysteine decarboxylase/phosphopantothenate--cysteine ligase